MAIERVSEAQDGTEANGASNTGDNRGISATGQFVVFSSAANNLGPADGDSDSDIYRVDTTTGDVVLVTAGSAAVPLTGPNRQPVVSADGNIVAFINGSGTTFNGLPQGDLYVVNVATGDIELIQSNAANPSLSADGTKLVFESTDDANGSGTDVNGGADVFLVTLSGVAAASIVRVSDAASGGVSGNGASYLPVISADGNFIAFESLASDLVGGDLNGTRDVFR